MIKSAFTVIVILGAVGLASAIPYVTPLEQCQDDSNLLSLAGPCALAVFSITSYKQWGSLMLSGSRPGLISLASYFTLTILISTTFYLVNGLQPPSHEATPTQFDYLYFSIVTFTTLGFGDFTPCPNSRLLAAAQATIGFCMYPILTALILDRIEIIRARGREEPSE